MRSLQIESNKTQTVKDNLTKELIELELTVKDVQEEIVTMKNECEQVEQEINARSEVLTNYSQGIQTEKARKFNNIGIFRFLAEQVCFDKTHSLTFR